MNFCSRLLPLLVPALLLPACSSPSTGSQPEPDFPSAPAQETFDKQSLGTGNMVIIVAPTGGGGGASIMLTAQDNSRSNAGNTYQISFICDSDASFATKAEGLTVATNDELKVTFVNSTQDLVALEGTDIAARFYPAPTAGSPHPANALSGYYDGLDSPGVYRFVLLIRVRGETQEIVILGTPTP